MYILFGERVTLTYNLSSSVLTKDGMKDYNALEMTNRSKH